MRRALLVSAVLLGLIGVALAPAASASLVRTFRGGTSQGAPALLTVSGGQASGTITWQASCGRLGTLRGVITFRNIPVSSRGWFGHRFAGTTNVSGWRDRWTARVAGWVAGGAAHGRLFDRNMLLKGSSKAALCRTGRVVWRVTGVAALGGGAMGEATFASASASSSSATAAATGRIRPLALSVPRRVTLPIAGARLEIGPHLLRCRLSATLTTSGQATAADRCTRILTALAEDGLR